MCGKNRRRRCVIVYFELARDRLFQGTRSRDQKREGHDPMRLS